MEIVIHNPKRPKAFKALIYGEPKVGKTTLCASFPAPIFLDGDDGLKGLRYPVSSIPLKGQSYSAWIGSLRFLYRQSQFQTLVIDTASSLEAAIEEDICTRHKVESVGAIPYGGGFKEMSGRIREVQSILDLFHEKKGMTVIFTAHAEAKTIADPLLEPYTRWGLALDRRLEKALTSWADLIGFAVSVKSVKSEQQGFQKKARAVSTERQLIVDEEPGCLAGNRFGLSDPIELSYTALSRALDAAYAVNTVEEEA